MTDLKPPMSGSYKGIFAFAICMAFLSLLGGSKGGLGTLLWCYTAWLMYKRNNISLSVLFKMVFWFDVIAGAIGFSIIAINQDNNLIGYSLTAYALLILIAALLFFLLMKFFNAQLTKPLSNGAKSDGIENLAPIKKPTIASQNTDLIWESISKEFNTSSRKEGLWAKCFVEADGDENKAKLQYLKFRFDEESNDFKSAQKILTTPALISKIKFPQDIFTIDCEPKVDSLDYSQFAASTLLSMGMFQRKQYKDRTFFYLHNGNVACISGQLIKVFDTESFLKKAIDKETISDRHPSGLIVSFDKDSIK